MTTLPSVKQLLTFLSIWLELSSTLPSGEFGFTLALGDPPACKFLLRSTTQSSSNTAKQKKRRSSMKSFH